MIDLPEPIAVALTLIFCIAITTALLRGHANDERQLLAFAAAEHIIFGMTLRYITSGVVFSEGDFWMYRDFSTPLVELARQDPFHYIPQLFRALMRMKNEFDFHGSDSTENMIPSTALGRLITFNSFYALYALVGWLSFLSKWGMYAVLRNELKELDRRFVGLAVMCIPSVVFWSSGIVKEAFAMIGFGPLLWGMRLLIVKRQWVSGLFFLVFGGWIVAAFKAYVLFPFGVAALVWYLFEYSKSARRFAFFYLSVGMIVGGVAALALGSLFPQFSPQELTERTAALQHYGDYSKMGADFAINTTDRSLQGQLLHAPLALLTTLTRPVLFEVHNATSLVAALEMFVLTLLFVRAVLKGGSVALRTAFTRPIALFAIVFTLLGATAIGLATTNFGTLSRYRVPIMPFYGVLVVVFSLSADIAARARADAKAKKVPLLRLPVRREPKPALRRVPTGRVR